MPTPSYRLDIAGQTITPKIEARLQSLTLTDARGFEVDTLDITLTDHDGALVIPPRGAKVHLWLGWMGQALEDKGEYIVDEVEHTGAPDHLTIRARSGDLRSSMTKKLECSFHALTLGDIVQTIAARNSLTPQIPASLAAIPTAHLDQTGESDANLLTRLAHDYGAIATIKAGQLLFIPPGQATTASGQAIPPVVITRQAGDQHRFNVADRAAYTAVRANYHNIKTGQRSFILVGTEDTIDSNQIEDPTQPTASNTKELRHTYATANTATRAAKAELARIKRGMATFSLTLAAARPDLFPEVPVTVQGFKQEIDATTWLITRATHRLEASSGFTTILEMELKIEGQ
jgi:uncharacterized protein